MEKQSLDRREIRVLTSLPPVMRLRWLAPLLGTEIPGEGGKEGGRKEGKDRQTGRPVLTQLLRTLYYPVLLGTYVVTCTSSHPPQRFLSESM